MTLYGIRRYESSGSNTNHFIMGASRLRFVLSQRSADHERRVLWTWH
jgi:hypothetical protein